jgi:putative membrane protein
VTAPRVASPRPQRAPPRRWRADSRAWPTPEGLRAGAQVALGFAAAGLARLRLDLRVEGAEHVPERGPLLLAVRHVHHLWDGIALLAAAPRPVHLLAGLDWVGDRRLRAAMELATAAAGWPVVVRAEGLDPRLRTARAGPRSAFTEAEALGYLRRAHRRVLALLAEGRALAVFPQGFPRIDPHLTVARGERFRAFRPGIVGLAASAQRAGLAAPIVPVGIAYADGEAADVPRAPDRLGRIAVRVRFGTPLAVDARRDPDTLLAELESRVRALSGLGPDRA